MPEAASRTPWSELARRALTEITPDETIGAEADPVDDEAGVTSVRFATLLPGYPGWHWTVSVAHLDGEDPSVLEAELMPGDGALLAPDWVPWADRLAEMKAQEARDGDEDSDDDESDDDDDDSDDSDDDDDDESDDDDSDDDEPGSIVHGGDVDGVDIDDLVDDSDDDDASEGDDDEEAADDGVADAPVVPAAHPEADLDDDSHDDDWDGEDEDPLSRRRK
ncbi:DUF3027 domain-containing protein [Frigoribacterium sp. Leaf186]|uniref:DUF3027 domain-containing protein n=1 Tax=Frigoribacterium sp. Leaf186 TaxID=1736293 RepID=UPI0006FA9A65|nr:DUF3027 domain-containing protein [Frigoribacterium sp. Leaf186]KQS17046.1 hypothetical protein ASG05_05735 [Frigoribacterium sp. Leaf186]